MASARAKLQLDLVDLIRPCAGEGFAVAASGVQALAQRSAEAAKEIKILISASAQQGIVAQVSEITGVVGEIAASAQEQAAGPAPSQRRR